MAIAPTGAIYKSLVFDGEDSRGYGVYITGEAVYNAPNRDVEMVSIPGRNGTFALDKGRFENVEITYPAGIFADNEADFAKAVSDFRNFLCSRNGYCRLTDEYNPEEYRMAIYKSGLEVTPAQLRAGEFEITFDCKPQRWLMGGEAAIDISDGDTLFNPTRFDASPLLEVTGYGTIGFNGHEIELENAMMGDVAVVNSPRIDVPTTTLVKTWTIDRTLFNSGDTLTWEPTHLKFKYDRTDAYNIASYTCTSITERTGSTAGLRYVITQLTPTAFTIDFYFPQLVSTSESTASAPFYIDVNTKKVFADSSQSTETEDNEVSFRLSQIGGVRTYATLTCSNLLYIIGASLTFADIGDVVADSTILVAGNPTYIDCDIGECYKIESGEYVSLNKYINLGSDLPKLASGGNSITFDNTITNLKVIPRWWKI